MAIPRLQLRADLITRRIMLRDRAVWVLKDPLSRVFHYFDESEYAILHSLRQCESFVSIARRYREYLEPEVLARFLSAATRAGLLVTPDEIPHEPAWRPSPPCDRPAWRKNPLAIRLPGLDPNRMLNVMVPAFFKSQPNHGRVLNNGGTLGVEFGRSGSRQEFRLSSRPKLLTSSATPVIVPAVLTQPVRFVLIAVASLTAVAVLILGMRLDVFLADLANASTRLLSPLGAGAGTLSWSSMSGTLIAFAMAVAVTKIVHEFAHAWACHAFGGRCREIGVLLLLGIPCLYCDVSDAWLMSRRRDRMLVSAAGVIAEWIIAAIAVCVWAIMPAGWLHDVSALIVVVASVNTLLVNGNPLLRYDGYYFLSDWTGVPNLSAAASTALRQFVAGCLGEPSHKYSHATFGRWLVVYAIASGLYRIFIMGVVVSVVFAFLSNTLGMGVAVPMVAWLGFALLSPRLKNWFAVNSNDARSSNAQRRSMMVKWGSAAIVVLILLVPLPRSIRVGGLVRPLSERPVYVREPGTLVGPVASTAADLLYQLDDWRLRLQEKISSGRVAELEAELEASRIGRLDRPGMSALQPILADELASELQKHAQLNGRMQNLMHELAPNHQLFATPHRRVTELEKSAGRWCWTGAPLSANNVGATLQSGTLVGRSGDPSQRFLSLYVPERFIGSVRVGQSVSLGLTSLPLGCWRGQVQTVSADPVDHLPAEIIAAGWASATINDHHLSTPHEVYYEVTVKLEHATESEMTMPARLVAPARIWLPASSLFFQWRRWFGE